MADQGTGLPGIKGEDVTQLVDMSGAAAPFVQLAHEVAKTAAEVGSNLDSAAESINKAQAQEDAAEGNYARRNFFIPGSEGYNDVMRRAQGQHLALEADAKLDEARAQFAYDPEKFNEAARVIREEYVNASPRDVVFPLSQAIDRQINTHGQQVQDAKAAADLKRAKGAAEARMAAIATRVEDRVRGAGNGIEALSSPETTADIAEMVETIDAMVENPAYGLSVEQGRAAIDEFTNKIKVAAITGQALTVLRTEGEDAYLAFLQNLANPGIVDPNAPPPPEGAPAPVADALDELPPTLRAAALAAARDAGNTELAITTQRENAARQERAQAEQDLARQMADDVASWELYGHGTGLTVDQIRQVGGESAVAEYYAKRADAAESYRQIGDLSGMSDSDAIARIAEVNGRERRFSGVGGMDASTPEGFDALIEAQFTAESNFRQFDSRGRTITSNKGAVGIAQMLDGTAEMAARRLGIPFDRNRLRNDRDYNMRLGREEMRFLLERYGGNTTLALSAYNAGPGAADKWIRTIGDPRTGEVTNEEFAARIPFRETREYVAKINGRLTGGRGRERLDAYERSREARATDPAGAVRRQAPVLAAQATWSASRTGENGAALVRSYLDAQERAGIADGRRQPLPNDMLQPYVDGLLAVVHPADGKPMDPLAFNAYAKGVMRQFNPANSERSGYGERVWQAVLERAGSDALSARVAARVATGQPVPALTARAATRTGAQANAATGARPATAPPQRLRYDPVTGEFK